MQYYAKIAYTVNDSVSHSIFAFVSWLLPHPDRYALGRPVELWCNSFGADSFVPLQNILCRCGHGSKLHNGENLMAIVPLVE